MPDPAPDADIRTVKSSKTSLFNRLLSRVRGEPEDREDIMTLLEAARARELIDADSYSMIKGAIAVSEGTAADIMVPFARMDVLDADQALEALLPQVLETAHSRFPVFEGSRENIIGVFMTKDLLRYMLNPALTLRDLLRPAVFIPESKRLNILLKEFRSNRNHIAIVIDEHGGITGLVTLEDVLEQIVGAIEDEYDVDSEQTIFAEGQSRWRIQATTPIDAFNAALDATLPSGDYETIGGWLAHELGRIPKRGDIARHDGLRIEVVRADARRALWLRVKRMASSDLHKDSASS